MNQTAPFDTETPFRRLTSDTVGGQHSLSHCEDPILNASNADNIQLPPHRETDDAKMIG